MKWIRQTGSTIELKDTPEMEEFAKSQGWNKKKPTAEKKAKKAK